MDLARRRQLAGFQQLFAHECVQEGRLAGVVLTHHHHQEQLVELRTQVEQYLLVFRQHVEI